MDCWTLHKFSSSPYSLYTTFDRTQKNTSLVLLSRNLDGKKTQHYFRATTHPPLVLLMYDRHNRGRCLEQANLCIYTKFFTLNMKSTLQLCLPCKHVYFKEKSELKMAYPQRSIKDELVSQSLQPKNQCLVSKCVHYIVQVQPMFLMLNQRSIQY